MAKLKEPIPEEVVVLFKKLIEQDTFKDDVAKQTFLAINSEELFKTAYFQREDVAVKLNMSLGEFENWINRDMMLSAALTSGRLKFVQDLLKKMKETWADHLVVLVSSLATSREIELLKYELKLYPKFSLNSKFRNESRIIF